MRSDNLKLHIMYAGNYYNHRWYEYKLHLLLKRLTLFQTAMITMLRMSRSHLITKEEMEALTKGLQKVPEHLQNFSRNVYRPQKPTLTRVCDDLDIFFEKIKAGKYSDKFEETRTYFLPKLTEKEMQLVRMKDENHLATYSSYQKRNYYSQPNNLPDIDEKEMKLSDSDSKYVRGSCNRKTFFVEKIERKCNRIQSSKQYQILTTYRSYSSR